MGMTWHGPDFREVELHREANDAYFGAESGEVDDHAASSASIRLPATMDEIVQRRNGTDEDPEGRFA